MGDAQIKNDASGTGVFSDLLENSFLNFLEFNSFLNLDSKTSNSVILIVRGVDFVETLRC